MFIHCKLEILMLVLTLHGQVHTGKISGGHEAAAHSRPYMVLLKRHMEDGSETKCDGFLLNEDFVMTAAHCHAKSYTVLLGLHDFHNQTGVQRRSVEQMFPHKDYSETGFINDIMLLQLSSKANICNNVKPITLADQDDVSPKSCLVSGWGKTETNSKHLSPKLMEVNVTLIHDNQCAMKNIYCSDGKEGPGEGDSGGPLVCENRKAYGVVSSRSNPDSSGSMTFRYTKIPVHKDWILCVLKQNGKC